MDQKWFGSNARYYVGVIEENDDSKAKDNIKLGRCRVRLLGVHSEELIENDVTGEGIPTNKLHWAYPINPVNSTSMNGIGHSPALLKGTWVICLSMDGTHAQDLYILGTIPGVPNKGPNNSKGFNDPDEIYPLDSHLNESDVNRLARNEKVEETIVKEKQDDRDANWTDIPVALNKTYKIVSGFTWAEPTIPYNAEYPFNAVYESKFTDDDLLSTKNSGEVSLDSGLFEQITDTPKKNGHIFELDSTLGNERIHLYHKAGTFFEIDALGNKVDKVIRDKFELTYGHNWVNIKGNAYVTIDGHSSVMIKGNANVEVLGYRKTLVHGDEILEVKGNRHTLIHGNEKTTVLKDNDENVKGAVNKFYSAEYNEKIGGSKSEKIGDNYTIKSKRLDLNPNGDILSGFTIDDVQPIIKE